MNESVYDFTVTDIEGNPRPLSDYRGTALLVVNVASRCGFTPQYRGLQQLHDTYKDRGFAVLGFPCNQFGAQEPGSEEEIQSFCELNFGVNFPLFAKIEVNGDGTHPLYVYLKKTAPGVLGSEAVKWNFTKFLVDRNGAVIDRYAPTTAPEDISDAVKAVL